jgi:hypothetical protein
LILKDWLGGLDSNQDSQIQNLESCQLDDLPVVLKSIGYEDFGKAKIYFTPNFAPSTGK